MLTTITHAQAALRGSFPAPTPAQQQIIQDIHTAGHFGVSAVLRRLRLDKQEGSHQALHVRTELENCEPRQPRTRTRHRYTLLRPVEACSSTIIGRWTSSLAWTRL
jgi:hypothetical protein